MKTMLILLAGLAIVAPVASAHILVYLPSDPCGKPSFDIRIPPGAPASAHPHGWIGITSCPYDHNSVPPPPGLDVLP